MAPTLPTTGHPTVPETHAEGVQDVGVPSTFVVALDGSDFSLRAVPIASWFAERFDADVLALTAPTTLDAAQRTIMPAWLSALVAEAGNPRMTASVVDNDPVRAIIDAVSGRENAVVCMATYGRGLLGSLALGNVAGGVLCDVGVPVLLVGRHCLEMPQGGPIVVGHDGSRAADAILATARAWAHHLDVPIVLVHVYHPLDVVTASEPTAAIAAALDSLGPGARPEVIAGSFPAGVIRDVAHELDASAIALSTHGRTGAARTVMGSVSAWVTRQSPCPVLAVRPHGLTA